MEETRFDAWTRRRFGLMAGSALAALAGWQRTDAKKKRCKKLGASCKTGGKRKCCGTLKCDRIAFEPSTRQRCCRRRQGDNAGKVTRSTRAIDA